MPQSHTNERDPLSFVRHRCTRGERRRREDNAAAYLLTYISSVFPDESSTSTTRRTPHRQDQRSVELEITTIEHLLLHPRSETASSCRVPVANFERRRPRFTDESRRGRTPARSFQRDPSRLDPTPADRSKTVSKLRPPLPNATPWPASSSSPSAGRRRYREGSHSRSQPLLGFSKRPRRYGRRH